MITLKQLNYARAVARTLHFGRAAEQCHVSQSALSTALAELENQLGLQLFERDNKRVLVTPVGQEVLRRAEAILVQVEDLQSLAESQQQPLSYPLSVGIIPTIAPYLLPRLLPPLHAAYPGAQLNIVEEESAVLVERVRSGALDSAILALPYRCDGLLTLEFAQEDFYWIHLRDGEAQDQREITSREIQDSRLMLLSEGHCLKDHILDVCRLETADDGRNVSATSLSTLIQMVLGGLGTTLIPAMALAPLLDHHPQLEALHLNEPSPHRRLAFIVRPNYTRLPSIERLMTLCRSALAQKTAR